MTGGDRYAAATLGGIGPAVVDTHEHELERRHATIEAARAHADALNRWSLSKPLTGDLEAATDATLESLEVVLFGLIDRIAEPSRRVEGLALGIAQACELELAKATA